MAWRLWQARRPSANWGQAVVIALRQAARKIGLGRGALYLYYRPIGLARDLYLEGGPFERVKTIRAQDEMRRVAGQLPTIVPPKDAYPIPVRFMTGDAYWYQTLFCFLSLQLHSERRVDVLCYDDGNLSEDTKSTIQRIIPWAQIFKAEETDDQIDRRMPRSRYPSLRARRDVYPHLRKLTDIHSEKGFSLVLDSDMLFFRRPNELLNWMADPRGVLHLEDVERSYGYSDALLASLSRGRLPEKMNVGLYGIPSDLVDFDYLESCCAALIEAEGPNYLQEQALTALAVSSSERKILPSKDYRVKPDLAEGKQPTAVLHHYVAHSKRSYFQHGWRHVLDCSLREKS